MPPDSQADGPGGQKARRTRGPASPGQRTAQPFGGDAECVPPALCVGGIGPRRRSAGTPQAAAHAGHRPHAGVRRPTRAAVHTGHRPSRAFRDPCGPPYTRGLGPPAGIPQASRRPPPRAGHRSLQAFRRPPAGRHHKRGLGPRGRSAAHAARRTRGASAPAGVPQVSRRPPPRAGHRPPAGVPRPTPPAATHGASALAGIPQAARRPPPHTGPQPSQAFRTPPAARARPHPPAARFSRKPPCGIGSRMVYCT